MADFSLQDLWWLKPKETDNPLPALQLGVNIAQNKAAMDLKERDLANDIARTSLMRDEMMSKQTIRTKIDASNAELARLAAQVTDFSDPAQMKPFYDLASRAGWLVGTKGWDGLINTHERAISAKRMALNTESLIDTRNATIEYRNKVEERRNLLADSTIDLNDSRIQKLDAEIAGMDRAASIKESAIELGRKKLELQNMLASGQIALNDVRVLKLKNDIGLAERSMAVKEGNQALNEKKLQLQQLLADHSIPLTDARIQKLQKETALAEREMSVKEGNVKLREREVSGKEKRFDATGKWSSEDKIEFQNRAKKAIELITDPEEADRVIQEIREDIEGKRQQREKFKSSKVERQGIQPSAAPTVTQPVPIAPGTNRVSVIAPDGKPGTIPESQLEEALKAGYKRP